jgi:hypothetical protein
VYRSISGERKTSSVFVAGPILVTEISLSEFNQNFCDRAARWNTIKLAKSLDASSDNTADSRLNVEKTSGPNPPSLHS